MKIAIFSDAPLSPKSGVATVICSTIQHIRMEHEVTLFVPGRKRFRVEKRFENLKIVKVPSLFEFSQYKGFRCSKPQLSKINKIVEKEKFDIIHIHTPFTLGLVGIAMSKLHSIPIVGTYHTLLPEYFPHLTKGIFCDVVKKLGEFPTKKFTKFVYSKVDRTIAPSKEIAKMLKGYEIKRVVWIPNGVELQRFKPNKRAISQVRKKYRIPRRKVLLYLGRISFEKKIEVLLKAFKLIEDQGIFLLIAGSGPYLGKYKKMAKELRLKNVRFTGFVEEELLPSVYHCADIYVSPSDTEVLPTTFLEAMACGLPLIGVKAGGVKDVIEDGKNGLLAKPNDPVDLAIKITALMNNEKLRRQMSHVNLKIAKRYSIEKSSAKLLRLYKTMKVRKGKLHPFLKLVDGFIRLDEIKQRIRSQITGWKI